MIKQTLIVFLFIVFLFPIFAASSMEIDELRIPSQPLTKAATKKIEVVTDTNKKDSYSVAISLCITQADRSQFAEKIQKIYDAHNLNLTYEDSGKFWQIPHVTLVIFEKVKLQDIEGFYGVFAHLDATSVQFTPKTCEFFGKGDWLVVKPTPSIAEKIKELNARVIDWAHENVTPETYKVQRNTIRNRITPHMALNTTVSTTQWSVKRYIKKALSEALKSMPIALEEVVITATNEWS